MRLTAIGISVLTLAACNQQPAQNQVAANAPSAPSPQGPGGEPPMIPADEVNRTETPAAKGGNVPATSLPEPKGPIDPKSVEAAGQVVQHYGALIEQGRWTASRQYWGDAEMAKAFERNFRTYADVHLEIGDLGESEGAAGSIYVTEPVTFYGKKNGGGDYRRKAEVTLRRVNDVDGSTEAQRRWHIERIEWK
jgi:hypothetical protein